VVIQRIKKRRNERKTMAKQYDNTLFFLLVIAIIADIIFSGPLKAAMSQLISRGEMVWVPLLIFFLIALFIAGRIACKKHLPSS
jgi:hypothetical protein